MSVTKIEHCAEKQGGLINMDTLITLLDNYGILGLILLVALYILLNSKFTIQYPKDSKSNTKIEFKE
ncbi:MAG: hypothetical protein LWX51_17180 [Deltaproteobacteria bacterium]|nr:hypothetical protein [Deltaproteobacteria bacterium]